MLPAAPFAAPTDSPRSPVVQGCGWESTTGAGGAEDGAAVVGTGVAEVCGRYWATCVGLELGRRCGAGWPAAGCAPLLLHAASRPQAARPVAASAAAAGKRAKVIRAEFTRAEFTGATFLATPALKLRHPRRRACPMRPYLLRRSGGQPGYFSVPIARALQICAVQGPRTCCWCRRARRSPS